MTLPAGARLGPYTIEAMVGEGGMGEVYRALDTRLDRGVAIKVLPESFAGDPDRRSRFEREAKAVAALSHPNILQIHDTGVHEGRHYLVMELLAGETLREAAAAGPMSVARATDTAVQIARGLAAAHEKGIVHRDLKPENVFLLSDGQRQDSRLRAGPPDERGSRTGRRDCHRHGPGNRHGHGRLHGARAGPRASCRRAYRICLPSARSFTSCWPAAVRSRGTPPPKP